jgi:hypothetical protein
MATAAKTLKMTKTAMISTNVNPFSLGIDLQHIGSDAKKRLIERMRFLNAIANGSTSRVEME